MNGIEFKDLITIVLTAIAVLLAAVTIIIALLAFWGYSSIREAAVKSAQETAKRVAETVAESAAKDKAEEVAVRQVEETVGSIFPDRTRLRDQIAAALIEAPQSQKMDESDMKSVLNPSPIEIVNAEILETADKARRSDVSVDLKALAYKLGLDVRIADLPPEIAGAIERGTSPSGYAVVVNARDNPRKRQFTLAHEIAHYVLHRDLIRQGVTDDQSYHSPLGEIYELQAKRMAADILMPALVVRSYVDRGIKDPEHIGRGLNVSSDAVRLRLKDLGID